MTPALFGVVAPFGHAGGANAADINISTALTDQYLISADSAETIPGWNAGVVSNNYTIVETGSITFLNNFASGVEAPIYFGDSSITVKGMITNDGLISNTVNSSASASIGSGNAWAYGIAGYYTNVFGGVQNNGTIYIHDSYSTNYRAAGIYMSQPFVAYLDTSPSEPLIPLNPDVIGKGFVENAGTIDVTASAGSADGINAVWGLSGDVRNALSGTINVSANYDASGITRDGYRWDDVFPSGALLNFGTITSTSQQGNAYGMRDFNYANGEGFAGLISNSGTITSDGAGTGASAFGIYVERMQGMTSLWPWLVDDFHYEYDPNWVPLVENTGSITASAVDGFAKGIEVAAFNRGIVRNTGSVSADTGSGSNAYGLYIGSGAVDGYLQNSGQIGATMNSLPNENAYSVYVGSGSLGGILISGNDTAEFIGEVYAPGTLTTVASDATYSMLDRQLFTVQRFANGGVLKTGSGYATTPKVVGDFANTGTFDVTVNSTSTYGKLVVEGDVSLAGALKVSDTSNGNLAAGNTFEGIISYTGARTGEFAAVTAPNSLFTWEVAYEDVAKRVDLLLTGMAASNENQNQNANVASFKSRIQTATAARPELASAQGASEALDTIAAGDVTNAVVQRFIPVPDAEIPDAIRTTLPILTGSSMVATSNSMAAINNVVQGRVAGGLGLASGDEYISSKNFWLKPFGTWTSQQDYNGATGYSSTTRGLVAGVDIETSATTQLGLAFARATAKVTGNSTAPTQSNTVDIYQLIAYGSKKFNNGATLSFQADAGYNKNNGFRAIDFTATSLVANAQNETRTAHVGVELSRSFDVDAKTKIAPMLTADYSYMRDTAYTETGAADLSLVVDARTTKQFVVGLGARLNHDYSEKVSLSANAGVGYDMMNKGASIVTAYSAATGVQFTTFGLDVGPWVGNIGAGINYQLDDTVNVLARYDADLRKAGVSQSISAKVSWAF